MEQHSRNCLQCEKPIKGRIDKKFCGDVCRNSFNNQLNAKQNSIIRRVNRSLFKNRRILESLLQGGKSSITCLRQSLSLQGFDFRFHTHEEILPNGRTLQFCYEYGFVALDEDRVRVLTRRSRTA